MLACEEHLYYKESPISCLSKHFFKVYQDYLSFTKIRRKFKDLFKYQTMSSFWIPVTLCSLLLLFHVVTTQNQDSSTLKIVHIIYRHGQRTPADTYPLDPHIDHTFEPYGWGQLTNDGKRAQFQQGEWLRQRYNTFLGERYSPSILKVQCTDVDRAKMSTQLMLAGLFPPKGDQIWNNNLMWQPIPIDHEPLKHDKLLLGRYPCPRYQEELNRVFKSPAVTSILDKNKELFKYATDKSGLTIDTPDDAQSLYSTLKAEVDFGLQLPDWTKQVYPEPLKKITAESFVINAMTPTLQRLKGGFLLKKIIEDTSNKLHGKTNMKMFSYGGHDSTVSNFLLTLDAWDTQVPEYNSLVLFEVHEMGPEKHGVKLFLRNSTTDGPYQLRIPGCEQFCPWDTFIQLTQPKIPTRTYEEECRSMNPNFVYRESSSGP